MEYSYPLVATHSDGNSRLFYDVESFVSFAFDRSNGGVGGYWIEGYIHQYWKAGKPPELVRLNTLDGRLFHDGVCNAWIVRDNNGRVVDKRTLVDPRKTYRWNYRWTKEIQHAAENGLPIPRTGKCRRYKHSRQGAWSKNGKNGAYNRRKGVRLYEDPLISDRHFDEF